MKFIRHGKAGAEHPGLVDTTGILRDLTAIVTDISAQSFSDPRLRNLSKNDIAALPIIPQDTRLGVPLSGIGKFIGIGMNYTDHTIGGKGIRPDEPVIFTKAISCLNGPNDPILLPPHAQKTDWEVELGVVFARTTRHVAPSDALAHVGGYVLVNDVSDRGFQNASGQWDKGKGCDTFGPVGPWLVTVDEIGDPQNLDLWLDLNGTPMQRGNTANMLFSVAELIANVSRYITLEAGDILTTGTPRGVGADQTPQRFLTPGDRLDLGIIGLGEQHQSVRT